MTSKLFLLFFIGLTLMVAGCSDEPPPAKKAASQQQPAPSPPPAPAPAPAPKPAARSAVWPFLSEDAPVGGLAENLTAKNYLLIFDGSGSMQDKKCSGNSQKIEVAKKAVTAWSKSIPANANLGLFAFHNLGTLTLPLATGNRDAFNQAIGQIQAGGKTPLSDAIIYAYNTFTEQGQRQLGYGEYTIVVVTDGYANSISRLNDVVGKVLSRSPIIIYSIGFCIGEEHSLNQPGRTIYKSADNPEQLQKGLQEVLAESESFDEDAFTR
ncbi:von Willebrand factor type A domain protein [Desulfosarcina variabilis str. Montpellier]|uniref:vWA domain-containing protein n=1 Tax=Desulfosarcina variabilis TaxID=2300 RepID=UPI003AFABDF0